MKLQTSLTTILSAALLAACGGGGSGSDAPAATTPTQGESTASASPGPVSAPFKVIGRTGYLMRGSDFSISPNFEGYTQRDDGAVIEFAGDRLTGDAVVKDIQGDADFAMGRWASGVFTEDGATQSVTFTEADAGYHYVMINQLSAFPASNTPTCDTGVFTAPTFAGGTAVSADDRVGRARGSATLAFAEKSAALKLSITATNAGASATQEFRATASGFLQTQFLGNASGSNVVVQLGSTADGKYLVAGTYMLTLTSGAKYVGAFKFRCR